MNEIEKKAFMNGLGIVAIFAYATVLVLQADFSPWMFILAALVCYPMEKIIYIYFRDHYNNNIRILMKVLPEIGFVTDEMVWDEKHTTIQILGKFHDENFVVEASKDYALVKIVDLPWGSVDSRKDVPRILEAINEANINHPIASLCLGEPQEDGKRLLYTQCLSVISRFDPAEHIKFMLIETYNQKYAFGEAYTKERPNMASPRGPVGFNTRPSARAEEPTAPAEEPMAPAAQNDTAINS